MKLTFHDLYTFFAIVSVLINIVLAILVLTRTARTALYITFVLVCLCSMVWNLCEFMRISTGKWFLSYIGLMGSAFLPTLMFHFVLTFVNPLKETTIWIVPAYVFSCLLAMISLTAIFHPQLKQFVDRGYWDISYFVFVSPMLFASFLMLINSLGKTQNPEERSRHWFVLIAFTIGAVTVTTDHVQTLNVPVYPLGPFGASVAFIFLALGIFKHRRAYDILAETEEKLAVLNELAAGIAHEIRNPLSSIKGASMLQIEELKGAGAAKLGEYSSIISEEIERLQSVLVHFQDFTRPLKVEKQPLSVAEVLRKTVRLAHMDSPDFHITVDISPELPRIEADPSLLQQLFFNMIKNARESAGPSGELIIHAESTPQRLEISFSDNGPGIPADLHDRIFEPFFTTKKRGMGLGLAICQRIVQGHGGTLEAKNRPEGGTTFVVKLPL